MEKHGRGSGERFGRVQGRSGAASRRQPEEHRRDRVGAAARRDGALRRWVQQAEVDAGRGPAVALTTSECEELTAAEVLMSRHGVLIHLRRIGGQISTVNRIAFNFDRD